MNGKHKLSGLALVALLATGILATSAQTGEQNKGEFLTLETPLKLVDGVLEGAQTTAHTFSTTNATVQCESAGFGGSAKSGTTKSLTLVPVYGQCTTFGGSEPIPTTVTVNGCDWSYTQPLEKAKDVFSGAMGLKCPEKQVLEIDLYDPIDKNHQSSPICIITFFPSEALGGEVEYKTVLSGGWTEVTANMELPNMKYEEHGNDCPDPTSEVRNDGEYLGGLSLAGTDSKSNQLDVVVIETK
jgi:hypothetical protein